MFQNLTLLSTAQEMARNATARQSMVAKNIANADTPGYKARDMMPFDALVKRGNMSSIDMAATRAGHMARADQSLSSPTFISPETEQSPDGNTVTVETEILKSIEAERQHSKAISIYQSSMNILRSSIGKGR
ncbi:MAG: FlgB family protein [Litoreibacter sp.]